MDREIALVQSRTFWAALLAFIAVVAKGMGWSAALAWAVNPQTTDLVLQGVTLIGIFGAGLFRILATRQVTSTLPKAAIILALVCAGGLLGQGRPAMADPDSAPIRGAPIQLHGLAAGAPLLTGNPVADGKNLVAAASSNTDGPLKAIELAISADTLADFTAAQAAYAALGDTAGASCNQSILDKLTALNSAANAKGLPKLHLAFDFAIARTVVMAALPGSTIFNACAPVADQTKQSVLQLVTGLITGATTVLPALGLP